MYVCYRSICCTTRSYVWHDSNIYATWTEHMYDITQLYMWCEPCFSLVVLLWEGVLAIYLWCHSFILVTWRIDVCDMTQIYIWHVFLQFYCCSQALSRCGCDVTHLCMRHGSFKFVTWLLHLCEMTQIFVWHNSFIYVRFPCICGESYVHMGHDSNIYVTWLKYVYDMTHILSMYVSCDSCICATWLNHSCHVTHSYMWHDSNMYVTWLIHIYMCVLSMNLCVLSMHLWHDSNIYVTQIKYLRDMTYIYTWHDSNMPIARPCMHVTWLISSWHDSYLHDMTHSYVWTRRMTWRIHTSNSTYPFVLNDSFIHLTRLIDVNMWHDSFMSTCDTTHSCQHVTRLIHVNMWHDSLMSTCDTTHSCQHVTRLIHVCR